MQHLLDFIHEHTLDEQVYLVVTMNGLETELLWERKKDGNEWRLRPKRPRPTEAGQQDAPPGDHSWSRVHRDVLLQHLCSHGAHMETVENELRAIVMTQIVFADMVLYDARKALGRDVVRRAVLSHRDFIGELNSALRRLVPGASIQPRLQDRRGRLSLIDGEGHSTQARSGHLSLVPPPRPAAPI